MPRTATDLTEFANVHLHYALAEITSIGDWASIKRALDHIRQAEGCLRVVLAESTCFRTIPEPEPEPGSGS